ncbi:MAG: flavodoxin family protein [Ruminococcaceae bacterium]|nr:flavodoxin family protein [Oscillospiraceae bacterium]
MKIIISDVPSERLKELLGEKLEQQPDVRIIADDGGAIKNCIGCFGCWVKMPGECVIRDDYCEMGRLFSQAEQILLVSRPVYGGYSPFVKNVLDRALGYLHPYFVRRKGETHHKRRYDNKIKLRPIFYGRVTEDERVIARRLVRANALNYDADYLEPAFFPDEQSLREVRL